MTMIRGEGTSFLRNTRVEPDFNAIEKFVDDSSSWLNGIDLHGVAIGTYDDIERSSLPGSNETRDFIQRTLNPLAASFAGRKMVEGATKPEITGEYLG